MDNIRVESSDSDLSSDLADTLTDLLPSLPQRKPVVALPTDRPAPAGAWAPGELSIQVPISGAIEFSTPQSLEMQRIDRRHLLIVCPGSWSPRTNRTARSHLAIGLDQTVRLHEFVTPARASGRAVKQRQLAVGTGPLAAVLEASQQCLHTRPDPAVLHGLVLAALPLVAQALR